MWLGFLLTPGLEALFLHQGHQWLEAAGGQTSKAEARWVRGGLTLPLDFPWLLAALEATCTDGTQEPSPPLKQKKAVGVTCE